MDQNPHSSISQLYARRKGSAHLHIEPMPPDRFRSGHFKIPPPGSPQPKNARWIPQRHLPIIRIQELPAGGDKQYENLDHFFDGQARETQDLEENAQFCSSYMSLSLHNQPRAYYQDNAFPINMDYGYKYNPPPLLVQNLPMKAGGRDPGGHYEPGTASYELNDLDAAAPVVNLNTTFRGSVLSTNTARIMPKMNINSACTKPGLNSKHKSPYNDSMANTDTSHTSPITNNNPTPTGHNDLTIISGMNKPTNLGSRRNIISTPIINTDAQTIRSGIDSNSVPTRSGLDLDSLRIRETQNQLEQPYEQQQPYPQQPYKQSHQSPHQQEYVSPPTADTNSSLVSTYRQFQGPHPPRWRWEDKTILLSTAEKLITDDGEECFGDLSLCSPTSSQGLAHSNATARPPLDPAYIQRCPYVHKGRCAAARKPDTFCPDKIHLKRIIHPQTDVRLGDCSFLDSCDLADKCPYVHYTPEFPIARSNPGTMEGGEVKVLEVKTDGALVNNASLPDTDLKPRIKFPPSIESPPEWIKCDISQIDLSIMGKFGVIIADPPWDIRMTLPYGTVPDQAIVELPLEKLQDQGIIFLWCTARTVEAGHSCLRAWGYEFCDEIAWVKVDHLSRLITVGRTGHWLNHTMEHCLVGSKGDVSWARKLNDFDVIVAQPRATSHKPDEIYEMIERLVGPEVRKIELFGRDHNIRKGWLTLGNQLPSTFIHKKTLKDSYTQYLAHIGRSHIYSPDWNPWALGFNKYGYGEQDDWREERKRNSVIKVSNGSGKGSGVNGGMPDSPGSSYNKNQQQSTRQGQQDSTQLRSHASNSSDYDLTVLLAESHPENTETQSLGADIITPLTAMYTGNNSEQNLSNNDRFQETYPGGEYHQEI